MTNTYDNDSAGFYRGVSSALFDRYNDADEYFICLDMREPQSTSTHLGNNFVASTVFLNRLRSIPIHYVNDGYCDCPDGSDEPGTAACSWIVRALRYTTKHSEFEPFQCSADSTQIVHSHINDGICDCCDGSDEQSYLNYPSRKCPKTCSGSNQQIHKKYLRHHRTMNGDSTDRQGNEDTLGIRMSTIYGTILVASLCWLLKRQVAEMRKKRIREEKNN